MPSRISHNSVHVEEINKQLSGIKPSDVIAPPTITYDLPERAWVARFFSRAAAVRNRDELHPLRMDLVRTLAQLCKRVESPCRRQAKRGRKAVTSATLTRNVRHRPSPQIRQRAKLKDRTPVRPAVQVTPETEISLLFCPFCKWADDNVGESQREKLWRIDSLARHLRTQHLRRKHTPFLCPYDGCSAILAHAEHFPGHVERHHSLHLPPAAYSPKSTASHKPAPISKPIPPPARTTSKRASSRSGPLTSTMSTVTKETVTRTSTRLVCPLCTFVDGIDGLIEHIHSCHAKRKAILFHCPYERCSGIVAGAVYFADHCKRQHPRN